MSAYSLDLDLLHELVDRMATFEQRFDAVQEEVDGRMGRVGAFWTGVAAAEQAEAHRRWVTGATEMREALTVLCSVTRAAQENYSSAVRANLQMWAS